MAISILQDRPVLPLPEPLLQLQLQLLPRSSSSSLLQFCLNYFACLFMVESLISGAGVASNLDDDDASVLWERLLLQFAACVAAI